MAQTALEQELTRDLILRESAATGEDTLGIAVRFYQLSEADQQAQLRAFAAQDVSDKQADKTRREATLVELDSKITERDAYAKNTR